MSRDSPFKQIGFLELNCRSSLKCWHFHICMWGIVSVWLSTQNKIHSEFMTWNRIFLIFNILPVVQLRCSAASHVHSLTAKVQNLAFSVEIYMHISLCPICITPSWFVVFFFFRLCTSFYKVEESGDIFLNLIAWGGGAQVYFCFFRI